MRTILFSLIVILLFQESFAQSESIQNRADSGKISWNYPGILIEKAPPVFFNPPAGMPLTSNDLDFKGSSVIQFNQFGSFGSFNSGISGAVKTNNYKVLSRYGYQNFNGFRQHNNGYGHTLTLGMVTTPSINTSLEILFYFSSGQIRLPGSLTQAEFEKDPYQADPRSIHRDQRRTATREALDINYSASFGKLMNNMIQIKMHGGIDFFIRTTEEFKVISRYGLGLEAIFNNKSHFGTHDNVLLMRSQLFTQPKSTEYYENLSGERSDQLEQIKNENARTFAMNCSDNFEVWENKMFILINGRFDREVFTIAEATLPSRSSEKIFQAFSPEIKLNFNVWKGITLFTSYGLAYRSPTEKELEDSPNPANLYNEDLHAQESRDFEVGIKGEVVRDSAFWFNKIRVETTFFHQSIDNLIVPYEAFLEEFFRNASKAERIGLRFNSQLDIIKGLTIAFSYTISHFIYKSNYVETLELDTIVYKDFSGNFEPGIPANNFFLSLSYERMLLKKVNVLAKLSYYGRSGLWVNDANLSKTSRIDLFDALLGIKMKFGHFNIVTSTGVNNVFNRLYVGYVTVNSTDRRFYNPGSPSDFYGSLNLIYTF
jgi:iron complex outermembrane recepter protein